MHDLDNVFISGGVDVVTLSMFTRDGSYKDELFVSNELKNSYIPG